MIPLPRIDRQLCTGCGRCLDVCPPQVLARRDGKAELVDPAGCIYCVACEDICPEGAIALPFLVVQRPLRQRRAGGSSLPGS